MKDKMIPRDSDEKPMHIEERSEELAAIRDGIVDPFLKEIFSNLEERCKGLAEHNKGLLEHAKNLEHLLQESVTHTRNIEHLLKEKDSDLKQTQVKCKELEARCYRYEQMLCDAGKGYEIEQ